MILCPHCGRPLALPGDIDAANDNVGVIRVLSKRQLLRRDLYSNLAKRVAALDMPSREIPNWMADTIYGFRGAILWPDGRPFTLGDEDIDNAFGNDGSFRWLRSFRARADNPLKQTPQEGLEDRLRLLDVVFQIVDFSPHG